MFVSKQTLKILAGLIWYIGGMMMLLKGGRLLAEANSIHPGTWWIWIIVSAGVLIGIIKAKFLFNKSCHKNLNRIESLERPRIWQFFRAGFFAALFLMILTGALLSKAAHGNFTFLLAVAVIDFAIATALLLSSHVFWRHRFSSE
ncbi:MAG: hypothetical protein AB7T22_14885 [Calditrichaceae bacterium]